MCQQVFVVYKFGLSFPLTLNIYINNVHLDKYQSDKKYAFVVDCWLFISCIKKALLLNQQLCKSTRKLSPGSACEVTIPTSHFACILYYYIFLELKIQKLLNPNWILSNLFALKARSLRTIPASHILAKPCYS